MKEVYIKNYKITKIESTNSPIIYSVSYTDRIFGSTRVLATLVSYEDAERFIIANATKTNLLREIRDKYQLTGIVTIEYNGFGDSGSIESIIWKGNIELENSTIHSEIEDWVYNELSARYGGWEINEGSQGNCEINFDNCSYEWHHGTNVSSVEYDDFQEAF